MNATYDAIVIGSGPGGATAALVLARAGRRVCVLEKDRHPRFHIGESILPRTSPLLDELGLLDKVRALPHVNKVGAEFTFGDGPSSLQFGFSDGLLPGFPVFNLERAAFDELLANEAVAAGAELRQETAVREIVRLADGDVCVRTSAGDEITARVLIDASGHGTVVGRHLGTRRPVADPQLQKVAYFEHFENVERPAGDATGHPGIVMCDEGWFWLIGVTETKTSVGFVARPDFVKTLGVPPDRLLQWAVARCPLVRHRMRDAAGPATNKVLGDFSYTCAPYAGPGYFLVGDAGCFLDPIFSTGVTLAMMGGKTAAQLVSQQLENRLTAAAARRRYETMVRDSTRAFWWLIKNYYRHSFRELLMNGSGPLQVHKAVISVLAGQVFPRPAWSLRWRLVFFRLCVWAQQYAPLVPRRKRFSLLAADADTLPGRPLVSSPGVAGRGLG